MEGHTPAAGQSLPLGKEEARSRGMGKDITQHFISFQKSSSSNCEILGMSMYMDQVPALLYVLNIL